MLPFGALAPNLFARAIIAFTSRMPNNWLGLRLAMLFRRAVTMRLKTGALDVERWGLRVRLHPLDNACEKNVLFNPQLYETLERRELAAHIARIKREARPFVFVDVGANVGLYSFYVAAQTAGQADIVAIEPEPGNMARLRFNLRANPSLPIRTFAVALGEKEDEVAIMLNTRDRGGTRMAKPGDAAAGSMRVRCLPLLMLLEAAGVTAIDALKIDVEAAEDQILVPFFRNAPPALWPSMVLIEDSSHEWATDLFAFMAEKRYVMTARSKQNVVLRRVA